MPRAKESAVHGLANCTGESCSIKSSETVLGDLLIQAPVLPAHALSLAMNSGRAGV